MLFGKMCMWFLLLFLFNNNHIFCKSEEYINNDENCDENCDLVTKCIQHYGELDLYILSNKELLRTITEAFYKTGQRASVYVKLNYNFQSFANQSNTNDTNCTSSQTTYVWSESALYLLGPRPLFWLTLFAVNTREANITIELPCLCEEVQFDLLGRLTYLIKVYAVMEYYDQSLQFINRYYFHAKAEGDDHYDIIEQILRYLIGVKYTLFNAMICLSIMYIIPYSIIIIKKMINFQIKETEEILSQLMIRNDLKDKDLTLIKLSVQEKQDRKYSTEQNVYFIQLLNDSFYAKKLSKMKQLGVLHIKHFPDKNASKVNYFVNLPNKLHGKVHLLSIGLVSMCITISLFIFNLFSMIHFREYINEVLKDNAQATLPVVDFIILWFIVLVFAICKSVFDYQIGDGTSLISLTATSVAVNLICLVAIHVPYMLLAFIYNPIQTIMTYFALSIYIFCGYLVFWSFDPTRHGKLNLSDQLLKVHRVSTSNKLKMLYLNKDLSLYKYFMKLYAVLGTVCAVIYFSIIISYILTLGNFDDYQESQNLLVPLVIGVVTYFIVKPIYNQIKQNHIDSSVITTRDSSYSTRDSNYCNSTEE